MCGSLPEPVLLKLLPVQLAVSARVEAIEGHTEILTGFALVEGHRREFAEVDASIFVSVGSNKCLIFDVLRALVGLLFVRIIR